MNSQNTLENAENALPQRPLVFISHAFDDHAIAQLVCAMLEERGVRCWIAPRDIPPGEDYPAAIQRSIADCGTMVLIFTSHASDSKFVKREVTLGVEHNLVIIPFRTEDVRPERDLAFNLAGVQWLEAVVPPIEAHISVLADRVTGIVTVPAGGSGRTPAEEWRRERRGEQHVTRTTIAVAVLVLGLAFGGYLKLRPTHPPDAVLRTALEHKLESTLSPLGVRIGCDNCADQTAHVNVRVEDCNATLSGALSEPQFQVLRATSLQNDGLGSVSYSIAPVRETTQVAGTGVVAMPKQLANVHAVFSGSSKTSTVAVPPAPQNQDDEEQRVKQLIATGRKQLAAGNTISAASNFEAALDIAPDNAAAKAGLAEVEKSHR